MKHHVKCEGIRTNNTVQY